MEVGTPWPLSPALFSEGSKRTGLTHYLASPMPAGRLAYHGGMEILLTTVLKKENTIFKVFKSDYKIQNVKITHHSRPCSYAKPRA